MEKPPGTSMSQKPIVVQKYSPNYSFRNGVSIARIILHYTSGPTAQGALSWFAKEESRVSAHYVIDKDGTIYQCVADADKAWHARGENADSIGIEHVAQKGDKLTDAQSKASAALCRWLLEAYNLKPEAITAHRFTKSNIGRTDCPGDLWKSEEELKSWVRSHVEGAGETEADAPKGTGRPYQPCPVPLPWDVTLASTAVSFGLSTGPDVYHLQCALIGLAYLRKPVGGELVGDVFNENVEFAVKRFQNSAKIVVDGIVGPQTRAALEKALLRARGQQTKLSEDAILTSTEQWHDGAWTGLRKLSLKVGDQEFSVASGARSAQKFRRPEDPRSVPGNLEPIPQGKYKIGPIDWANGEGSFEGSHGAGLGPVWIPLDAEFSDDRGAFGFHLDQNINSSPGSAGCVVFRSISDLKRFVTVIDVYEPKTLIVDWKLA